MNPTQRADDIQSQQQLRYGNRTHVISKRQAIPAHCCPINPPPCVYNNSLPHEYTVPTIFEPIVMYEKPDEPLVTVQEDPQLDINGPILTHDINSQLYAHHEQNRSPVYTLEYSDPAQLSDPDFWRNFLSKEMIFGHGNQSIVVKVFDPTNALDSNEPTTTESSELKTTTAEFTTEITDCASTTPNLKSSFETGFIQKWKRINEKLDQNSYSSDKADADDGDECEGAYDCDETTEKPEKAENEPVTEADPDPSSTSERSDRIRKALAALLQTVHALQSRDNNEIIQMFRNHHSAARSSI